MNVLAFREALNGALDKVPGDAELALDPELVIRLTRNGRGVGEIKISENEITTLFHRSES